MSDYITPLKDSPDYNNPDYIRGMKEALDAVDHISDDLNMKLVGSPAYDEFSDFVNAQWKKLGCI